MVFDSNFIILKVGSVVKQIAGTYTDLIVLYGFKIRDGNAEVLLGANSRTRDIFYSARYSKFLTYRMPQNVVVCVE